MIIFVFGSNLAGRHGKGAALFARKHYGAIYGQGTGLQGRSYAIPTKDENLKTLPLTPAMSGVPVRSINQLAGCLRHERTMMNFRTVPMNLLPKGRPLQRRVGRAVETERT